MHDTLDIEQAINDIGEQPLEPIAYGLCDIPDHIEWAPYGDTEVSYRVAGEVRRRDIEEAVQYLWDEGEIDYIDGRYILKTEV